MNHYLYSNLYLMNLSKLIKQGESESLEFKQSFDKETIETLCAMANRNGGTVLIGIGNKGEIKGVQTGKETLPQWLNQIGQVTEPRLIPAITEHKIKGKTIVSIEIASYPIKPISCNGRSYLRVSSSNKQLNTKEIADLHHQTTHNSWDTLASDRKIEELDIRLIKQYIKQINTSGRRNLGGMKDWKQILQKLEFIVKKKPTWACFLLFKKNASALPHTIIRVARFKGTSTIIDDNFIEAPLISQIETTMQAIRKNLRVEYKITGKPKRDEIWEYPLNAIREALLNAICHRDYRDNSDVLIKIYDDQLSIWNPGTLPYNLSIEELLNNQHSSKPRNKLITQAFYDIGEIERLGSGIKRIMDACKEAKLPVPEIKEEEGGFYVIFKRPENNIYDNQGAQTEMRDVESQYEKSELNERQRKVITYVENKGRVSNSEYQKMYKVSARTATRELIHLVNKNIFVKVGKTGKGTFYQMVRSNTP